MHFGDPLKKEACLSATFNPKPITSVHKEACLLAIPEKEACLSATLTLNLKFPHIKKHAFWRFPKQRSMPFAPGGYQKYPWGPRGYEKLSLRPRFFSSHWLHASTQLKVVCFDNRLPKGCQSVAKGKPGRPGCPGP